MDGLLQKYSLSIAMNPFLETYKYKGRSQLLCPDWNNRYLSSTIVTIHPSIKKIYLNDIYDIKYLQKKGKTPKDIYNDMHRVLGDDSP